MSYSSRTRYGGSNYANRSFGSKPVETGKEYNVQITETSRKGDGIAKIQGFVIFVKDAKGRTGCKGKGYLGRREVRYGRNCCIGIKKSSKLMINSIIHNLIFYYAFRSNAIKTRGVSS